LDSGVAELLAGLIVISLFSLSSLADGTQADTLAIRFVDPVDGATVAATLDPEGRPEVPLTLEATGPAATGLSLGANGAFTVFADNPTQTSPFRATLLWSPRLGQGPAASRPRR